MTIPSWAVPGAKVVCVWDLSKVRGWVDKWMPNRPIIWHVYTVRDVAWSGQMNDAGLVLEEIVNPKGHCEIFGGESGFPCKLFKPVTNREIESEIFRKRRLPAEGVE